MEVSRIKINILVYHKMSNIIFTEKEQQKKENLLTFI